MTRREILTSLVAVLVGTAVVAVRRARSGERSTRAPAPGSDLDRLELTPAEWKQLLPAAAYAVLFEEATEPPGSSPLEHEQRQGTFVCAACFLPLFRSETKFDSGTGWPSFFDSMPGRVATRRDFKLVFPRTEYHCIRCGGHQGHVFRDGPPPTGLRYCNNGVALRFVPDGEALPALRVRS
jgi:peptide-methionine (R)-S-oxide reductase